MSKTPETIREIDAFLQDHGIQMTPEMRAHVAKIRAHADADELERKRLQAELLRGGGWSVEKILEVLELSPGWELAPQEARRAAHLLPPVRICAKLWNDDKTVVCHRRPGHRGEHCPLEGCTKDHD